MTDMETVRTSLLEWERAEIQRSDLQARLTVKAPKRTSPDVLARYANPPHDTAYAWEYAFHLLGDARGQRVLDLGCGDGQCTTLVASHGGTVTALDISTELLSMARVRSELDGNTAAVRPLCASIHAMPIASESVDIVFGMAVLHHVDLELAAREVHRVLKPGGRAIFCEPIRNSKVVAALRQLVPYRQPDVSPFERPLRSDEIQSFASRFASLEWREFSLPHVQLLRVCKVRPSWQAKAYAADARLLGRWPGLRRYASIVVFQVRK
jgi:SAM-dependent methyltransferase